MAKQKKKTTQIGSLEKVLGRMANITTQNPAEFRRQMDVLKARHREYAEILGLLDNPSRPPQKTKESIDFLHRVCDTGTLTDYILVLQTLLIGHWMSHRLVYTFTQDAIDYMHGILHIQDFILNIRALQKIALQQPIYIEAPPGSPISKAILGKVSFLHNEMQDAANSQPADFCCYMNFETDRGRYATVSLSGNNSVHESLQLLWDDEEGHGEEMAFALKLVAYIGYMRAKKDAAPLTFVEESIRNGTRYLVQPICTDSILSDETVHNGWIRAGLAPVMGYFRPKEYAS